MKRKIESLVFGLSLLLCASCARKVSLPIKTSLGDLTKVEKRDQVKTNKDPVSPKSGEAVYVLTFEGKKEYEVTEVAAPELVSLTGGLSDNSDINFNNFNVSAGPGLSAALKLPLVDASGNEFAPVYFGNPTGDGTISNVGAHFNGHVTGKNGKPWVKTGKFDFAESKVAVVYVVPAGATLKLQDGSQNHPIN